MPSCWVSALLFVSAYPPGPSELSAVSELPASVAADFSVVHQHRSARRDRPRRPDHRRRRPRHPPRRPRPHLRALHPPRPSPQPHRHRRRRRPRPSYLQADRRTTQRADQPRSQPSNLLRRTTATERTRWAPAAAAVRHRRTATIGARSDSASLTSNTTTVAAVRSRASMADRGASPVRARRRAKPAPRQRPRVADAGRRPARPSYP